MRPRFYPTEISRIDHYLRFITFDFHETSGTASNFFDLSIRATSTLSEGLPPDYTITINTDYPPIFSRDGQEGDTLLYLTCFNHGGTELGENNPMSKVRWLALRGRGRSVSSIPSTCCLTAHYPSNHTPPHTCVVTDNPCATTAECCSSGATTPARATQRPTS